MKTIETINRKIAERSAVVYTAAELKAAIADGENITAADVDVVTTGTFGIMSGTLAVLHIPVAPSGSFRSAEKVWLNGVPAMPGPCPNEGLGSVDVVIYGTARAGPAYGGGHLFRDLVAGNEVVVEVESGGRRFVRSVTIADLGLARMITTRSAFRNYIAVVNTLPGTVESIFSVMGLAGPYSEASVSGCGDINPLQNDPGMDVIGTGTRILLNGAPGYIMGTGTRGSPDKPNLAAFADMKSMVPDIMGGVLTSLGPECNTSVAVPIPVISDAVFKNLMVMNRDIPLPIGDVRDRVPFAASTYADVWDRTDPVISFRQESCVACEPCSAEAACPAGAVTSGTGIDTGLCVNCGTCVRVCPGNAFHGRMGELDVNGRSVPITLRQSDRARALRLCDDLKALILEGKFSLVPKSEDLF